MIWLYIAMGHSIAISHNEFLVVSLIDILMYRCVLIKMTSFVEDDMRKGLVIFTEDLSLKGLYHCFLGSTIRESSSVFYTLNSNDVILLAILLCFVLSHLFR